MSRALSGLRPRPHACASQSFNDEVRTNNGDFHIHSSLAYLIRFGPAGSW
ncbi:MAG: hypothetical protein JO159_13180 [Acidobacteria bacterium]|nr:hypothetical protein [Acidobacteriota bacterium]